MRIAIDAMGGDNAPHSNVDGALAAAIEWQDVDIILVGDQAQIEPLLHGKEIPANLTIQHASEIISSDDEPVKAVRHKKDASMVVAGRMLKEGHADAMISAGNTGALMTTGLLVVGRMAGIERPALAPMIPTLDDVGVLALDLGANMDSKSQHLAQYGLMGSIYRQKVQGIAKPRVGLLNVGVEPGKGNELTKEAFPLLQEMPIHFIGNVEARDVMTGNCDVLVCDGFAGNILLKTLEGTAGAMFSLLKEQFNQSLKSKIGAAILMPQLKALKKKLDYSETGGAPLLGLSSLVMKSHGSSNGTAIKNAVRQTRIAIVNELVPSISKEISGK
ncbi:phosphate acyltransferase PlsX [Paenibacillus crassostreae]|uniref:Phosphate acyltransferase n=1 Tax=Paenibacillus crassostreae TaxID=1763538 RepID=A0A167FPW2_9BACL|nr:phosphate acyltransferase PlsX [Paenibacillus crassostreae]AOZ94184.1 phosphate acyltransferase [Paenibacillus crassostreae]OAB76780.1 phosphate acyltransferase [Paenibacillus crassostreae]